MTAQHLSEISKGASKRNFHFSQLNELLLPFLSNNSPLSFFILAIFNFVPTGDRLASYTVYETSFETAG
jgi:hypothetical protein